MGDDTSIEIKGLTKQFGSFVAVDDISLSVLKGEIFGFLGPNGAGKTTTIKIMAGLLEADRGEVRINGRDCAREPLLCKGDVGYIPDRPYLYEKLTGGEFLEFLASLFSVPEESFMEVSSRYLELLGLSGWRDHLIESYSHGMKQKLVMASALMHDPPVIVVDEPMVGLDPRSARIVKEIFKSRAEEGTSIFLSTHSLEIAEELCDRIAIIVDGRIRAMGNMGQLRQEARMEGSSLEEVFLELTGAFELQDVVAALRGEKG